MSGEREPWFPSLPRTDLTLNDARSKLAGWHFAQESLTTGEREILYVAEAVLRALDEVMTALRLAYPYALDAFTNAETPALKSTVHEDMLVISAARRIGEGGRVRAANSQSRSDA